MHRPIAAALPISYRCRSRRFSEAPRDTVTKLDIDATEGGKDGPSRRPTAQGDLDNTKCRKCRGAMQIQKQIELKLVWCHATVGFHF